MERRLKQEVHRRNRAWLPSRLELEPGYTARFDIPGYADPYGRGIPTSIKSACFKHGFGQALLHLADAVRIVELANVETMRLLVAFYEQAGAQKVFREVREYLITGDEWGTLAGHTPVAAVEAFATALKVSSADQARVLGREWQRHMADRYPQTALRWNPKIGKQQRRLQCSVHLRDLEAVIADPTRIKVFGAPLDPPGMVRPPWLRPVSRHMWGDGMRLPVVIASGPRQRHLADSPTPTLDAEESAQTLQRTRVRPR